MKIFFQFNCEENYSHDKLKGDWCTSQLKNITRQKMTKILNRLFFALLESSEKQKQKKT